MILVSFVCVFLVVVFGGKVVCNVCVSCMLVILLVSWVDIIVVILFVMGVVIGSLDVSGRVF